MDSMIKIRGESGKALLRKRLEEDIFLISSTTGIPDDNYD